MTAVALLVGAAVAALLVRLEMRRADRRRLGWRIAATLAAVAMLVLLWLQPAVPGAARASRAVLLTPGASDGEAEALARVSGASTIIALDSVRDLAALRRAAPDIGELAIAGWGLPPAELERTGALALSFAPAALPEGIRELRWPPRAGLGDEVRIEGRTGAAGDWVHLAGPGIAPDSARSDSAGGFALAFLPKAAGLQPFILSAHGATDTAAVDVRGAREPDLLMLLGRPDFEASRLRRRIAERGGAVAARTTLSRGRVRREALNGAPMPGGTVDSALFAWADVVYLDGAAATTLSAAERAALRTAVTEGGLGMIADGAAASLLGFTAAGARPAAAREVRIRLPGRSELLPPIATEPVALASGAATEVVLEDPAGRPVAVAIGAGAGRIAVSAIRNPSRWLLSGDAEAFDRYWSAIVGAVRRPRAEWRVATPLIARAGEPVEISWPGPLAAAVLIGEEGRDTVHLAMAEDSLGATGRVWPTAPGAWALAGGGDTLRFLVGGAASWRALDAAGRVERTRLHAALHSGTARTGAATMVREAIPPWLFWAAFTVSAGWLWWERRRTSSGEEGRTGVR